MVKGDTDMNTQVYLGDRVRYESAGGFIRGEVVDITIALTAAGTMAPFYTIETLTGQRIRICGDRDYLAGLKFKVTFRDAYAA